MKIEKSSVLKVDYRDIENLIKEVYGKDFSIPCDEESGNDTSLDYDIDGEISEYTRARINTWINNGSGNYITKALMNDLCANGHLEKGNYIISISW